MEGERITRAPISHSFSSNGELLARASDKGGAIFDLSKSHDRLYQVMSSGPDMAGEGCGLVVAVSESRWACTGDDSSPENSSRLVRLCDERGTILAYRMTRTPVLALRVYKPAGIADNEARIVVVTQSNIFVYDLNLGVCGDIDIVTESNPNGAVAVTSQPPFRIAYPCPSIKGVKVRDAAGGETAVFQNTFTNNLQLLAFSPSGRRLAATDQDGTTVYSLTFSDEPSLPPAAPNSYRRGTTSCRMTSLCYNSSNEDILCCSSDHGTTHVFNISPSAGFFSVGVAWNFQLKDGPPYSALWCHFSTTDPTRLYRVSDSFVYLYRVSLDQPKNPPTLELKIQ